MADFYCAEVRLVIEIDGGSHNDSNQKEYDKIRDKFLAENPNMVAEDLIKEDAECPF